MKIKKRFNKLSKSEYYHVLANHKKYTNFNILGIYRSILETEKLDINGKIEIRDAYNKEFQKTFDFMVMKDPGTYRRLRELDEDKVHQYEMDELQKKVYDKLKKKHRSFGVYSKHICGYDTCPLNGLMLPGGSSVQEYEGKICFKSDKSTYGKIVKDVLRKKKKRKFGNQRQNIINEFNQK